MGRSLLNRVPRPLALLLACAALLSIAWAMFTPPWEGPDETMHYGYVETLAQRQERPSLERGQLFSTAQALSMRASNADKLISISDGRPQWSTAVADDYAHLDGNEVTDNGGRTEKDGSTNLARNNPPTFYVLELPVYGAAALVGGVNARLYAMRLAAIFTLLGTITAMWLLVGELFGRRPLVQLAGASVGLLPMATHLASTVSPDTLMYTLWAFFTWLGVRAVKRGFEPRVMAWLVLTFLAAVLTKGTSVALAVPLVGLMAYGASQSERFRRRLGGLRGSRARTAAVGAVALVAAILMVFGGFARYSAQLSAQLEGGIEPSHLASYLWQFYLPRLGFMTDISTVKGIPVYDVWFKDIVGNFAWLQIQQPSWVYAVLGIATAVVLCVGGVTLWRTQPRVVVLFVAAIVGTLVAGLHLTDYQQGVKTGVGFMQGRYMLPAMAVFAAFVAAAWTRLPERWVPRATALTLGLLIALQVISFSRAAGFWYV